MTMSNLDNAIERLKESRHYKDLRDYKPPFNPFEVMGVPYDRESHHSSVLAWLLNDGVNMKFRQQFVAWVAKQNIRFDDETKDKLKLYYAEDNNDIEVRREYGDSAHGRVDVFASFRYLQLAIAIEVKIWASEGPGQLRRYQDFLNESHSNYKNKIVIFLTPWGNKPSTANECSDVPVVRMSWHNIVEIIDEVNDASEKVGEEYIYRKQFSQHIKRNILMNTEEKRIVRDLLSDEKNATTIHKIFHNLPPLTDYFVEWKEIVAKVCEVGNNNGKLIDSFYPTSRAAVRELKIEIEEWNDSNLPFTLMLYKFGNVVSIRMLLWSDCLNGKEKIKLEKLKNDSNGIVEYKKLAGWGCWSSVLFSDGGRVEVPETMFNIYNKNWKEEAKIILERQLLEVKNVDGKNLLQLIKDNLN